MKSNKNEWAMTAATTTANIRHLRIFWLYIWSNFRSRNQEQTWFEQHWYSCMWRKHVSACTERKMKKANCTVAIFYIRNKKSSMKNGEQDKKGIKIYIRTNDGQQIQKQETIGRTCFENVCLLTGKRARTTNKARFFAPKKKKKKKIRLWCWTRSGCIFW